MAPKVKPRELVLAKMPSYPPWPSFLMPKDLIPDGILGQRRKLETCVIFIPEGDYIWLDEKDLQPLDIDLLDKRIKATKSTGKTKKLRNALQLAKELKFDTFMSYLEMKESGYVGDLKGFLKEQEINDEEEKEEVAEAADDELDEKEEEDEIEKEITEDLKVVAPRPNGRRSTRNGTRIKNGDSNGDDIKSELDKKSDDEITRKRKGSETNGAKRFKTVSPPIINTETEEAGTKLGDGSKAKRNEALSEDQKLSQLWLCRIKLQKSLIQRSDDSTPTIDELSISRLILHKLVDFPIDLNLLKTTKIHKVLKCILKDPEFELTESFKLHEKCNELLDKWANLIEAIKREKNGKYDESEVSDIKEKPIKTIASES